MSSRAKAVLVNRHAWNEVIETANPFEDIQSLGSKIKYTFSPSDPSAKVELNIRNKQVVPRKSFP